MPTINNWEEWDELEDETQDEFNRKRLNNKSKTHTKKEWDNLDERIQKDNNVKYVKSKRKVAHKNNNQHLS
jgi:hypothetical protein